MLGLELRDEFLAGEANSAVDLRKMAGRDPGSLFDITYPAEDALIALEAMSGGVPLILMGGRGSGKSHVMALMHHAAAAPDAAARWLAEWGAFLGDSRPTRAGERLPRGFLPVSEAVHAHEHRFLWDILFARHPRGERFQGRFEEAGTSVPARSLLEDMFADQPVCLILDELQTWYDSLPDTPRKAAFNFIQLLAELALDHPDRLILAVSVRDNGSEIFRQLRRDRHALADFGGAGARADRRRLILHRLFANRRQIPPADIAALCRPHADARVRLLRGADAASDDGIRNEAAECWPFSPELLSLLQDSILLAPAAQETRDLIRILALAFRGAGSRSAVITPADFRVDGDDAGVQALLDSIAEGAKEKLREIAARNLEAVRGAGMNVPNAGAVIASVWMRSMSPGRDRGATREDIQLDISGSVQADDNAFHAELARIVENSFNIHEDTSPGGLRRLRFDMEENPRARLLAAARNDKLWAAGDAAPDAGTSWPGADVARIRHMLRHMLSPEGAPVHAVVPGPAWRTDPWDGAADADRPERWERPVLLAVPEHLPDAPGPDGLHAVLGRWLKEHVQKRRNTVRFLLPAAKRKSLFADPDILLAARRSFLCSQEAWGRDAAYAALSAEADAALRGLLRDSFDHFAIPRRWSYTDSAACVFDHEAFAPPRNGSIPGAVEEAVRRDLLDPAAFEARVLDMARTPGRNTAGDLLDDLMEPPAAPDEDAIPWIGTTDVWEKVLDMAARGLVAVCVDGERHCRRPEDASDEVALRRIRTKAFRTGRTLREAVIDMPGAAGGEPILPAAGPSGTAGGMGLPGIAGPSGTAGVQGASGGDAGSGPGSAAPPVRPPHVAEPRVRRRSFAPATGLNHLGGLESCGVLAGGSGISCSLRFSGLTGTQIRSILQSLPPAVRAELEVEWTEADGR